MVHIYDGVAMNPLELRLTQALFNGAKRLGGQQSLFGSNDPDQFPLCLKGEHLICVQENIVRAVAPHYPSAFARIGGRVHGGDLGNLVGDLDRPVQKTLGPLDGLLQTSFVDRFQEVIDSSGFKGLNSILVESSHDNDNRQRCSAQASDHFKAAHYGHLQVEKNQVGPEFSDLLQGLAAVLGLAHNCDFRNQLQFLAQEFARNGLV